MRTSRGIVAIATSLALSAIPQAAFAEPDQVLAHGRDEGGLCVFDGPVYVIGTVRADEKCRLIAVPSDSVRDVGTLGPPSTHRAKTRDDTPGQPNGLGGIGVNPGNVAGAAGGLAGAATSGMTTWHGWAYASYFNESNQLMYEDKFDLYYQESRQDGRFSGATGAGGCTTGPGTFPHQPVNESCTWSPGFLGPDSVTFVSGGTYADYLLLARYDHRSISMNYIHTNGTDPYGFCPLVDVPPRWRLACDVQGKRVGP